MILQNKLNENGSAYKMLFFNNNNKVVEYIQNLRYKDYELIKLTPNMRLDRLAYKYYNDSSLWWVIAKINNIQSYSFFVGNVDVDMNILIPLKDINNLAQLLI